MESGGLKARIFDVPLTDSAGDRHRNALVKREREELFAVVKFVQESRQRAGRVNGCLLPGEKVGGNTLEGLP